MGSAIEHKPGGSALDAGEFFLTPRVVDEGAFSQYAARLRELIERAGAAAEQAKLAAEAGRPLPSLVGALRKDLDAASQLLSAAEERAAEVRAVCEQAADHALLIRRFEEDAARLIDDEERRLKSMLASVAEMGEQQATQVKTRLDQWLGSRREQAEGLRTLADSIVADARSRLDEMQRGVEEARSCFEGPASELRALAAAVVGDAQEHIEKLQREREAADAAAERQAETARRLEAALEMLAPWRSVLLSDEAEGELPPKLAEILGRAQRELSRPLLELGAVIQTFAQRGGTAPGDHADSDAAPAEQPAEKPTKKSGGARSANPAKKTNTKRSTGG